MRNLLLRHIERRAGSAVAAEACPLGVCMCVLVMHQRHAYSVIASRICEMQSTADWTHETSTKFQTKTNSSEDTMALITSAMKSSSGSANVPYNAAIVAVGVAGILTNAVVLFGFCVAGRSKMNVSSAYIANHTTLEQKNIFSIQIVILDRYTNAFLTSC